ncbi:hypothetical protein MJ1_0463 [Nanobdella aerobiophila]|uniref:PAC2 family protein n=1 Tax=Nanobdella aerobiophila TaxID=2586965 RepID=A0A915SSV1_9ARCH|nr:PAC2 family protein [Nanobdella aerobiophila]BBL45621.1 hypothetical protein MJ1_0463 [Nanobdella aerobiophila]
MEFILDNNILKNMKNAVFLYSIGGGFGNVAKVVGKTMIRSFKSVLVGRILSDFFPDLVYINKKGIVSDNISYKLYNLKVNETDFLILYGDFQVSVLEDPGLSLYLRYRFMNKLFKKLKRYDIKEYAILGGSYNSNVELEAEDPNYMFAFNKFYNINNIKEKIGDINIFKSQSIVGMSGLTLYYSQLYKKPAYALLVQTYPTNQINGYYASSKALEILGKIYNFNIDLTGLREKGKKLKESIEKDISRLKELQENQKKSEERSRYYFG